jgi:hypothetical protein
MAYPEFCGQKEFTFQTPIGLKKFLVARPLFLLLLPLVITFLLPSHYFYSTTTNKRTNEQRTNEQRTNEQ